MGLKDSHSAQTHVPKLSRMFVINGEGEGKQAINNNPSRPRDQRPSVKAMGKSKHDAGILFL